MITIKRKNSSHHMMAHAIKRSHVMCSMKDRNVEHIAKCSSQRMSFCVDKDVTRAMEWGKNLQGQIISISFHAQNASSAVKRFH